MDMLAVEAVCAEVASEEHMYPRERLAEVMCMLSSSWASAPLSVPFSHTHLQQLQPNS